jgi:hypothetical protein
MKIEYRVKTKKHEKLIDLAKVVIPSIIGTGFLVLSAYIGDKMGSEWASRLNRNFAEPNTPLICEEPEANYSADSNRINYRGQEYRVISVDPNRVYLERIAKEKEK